MDLSEAEVLKGCIRLLDFLRSQQKLTYRRINVGGIARSVGKGRIIHTKNSMRGMSDLLVFLTHHGLPKTVHIEVKSTIGKLSPEQIAWQEELAEVGHYDFYVVREARELERLLASYYAIVV